MMMPKRAVILGALVIASCGAPSPSTPPAAGTCQVWIYPPSSLPILWTCTSGNGDATTGRPDHLACVRCADAPLWQATDGGTCVPDCSVCTPAQLLALDPLARCEPNAEPPPPNWLPRDMMTVQERR